MGRFPRVPRFKNNTDTICEPNPTRGISLYRVHCASAGISFARWVRGSGRNRSVAIAAETKSPTVLLLGKVLC